MGILQEIGTFDLHIRIIDSVLQSKLYFNSYLVIKLISIGLYCMNFHRLKVFYTVAQQASFSRAAEKLFTSQPNVSKHVRQLEVELGTPLFHRLGHGIELTEAG